MTAALVRMFVDARLAEAGVAAQKSTSAESSYDPVRRSIVVHIQHLSGANPSKEDSARFVSFHSAVAIPSYQKAGPG